MLIYNETRFVPTEVNMLVIRGKDNHGFFYIHRALYDQAVILNDIYGEDINMLIKAITGSEESRPDVDLFLESIPTPINIFAPFLLMVTEELTELEDMIGAIHVMSGPINFRKMLKVSPEMRNTPTFSLSIREEYVLAWDRFLQTVLPYTPDMFLNKPEIMPMNGVQTTTIPDENGLSNIGDDGVEYADPLEALLYGASDDIFDIDDDEIEGAQNEELITNASSISKEVVAVPIIEKPVEPEVTVEPAPEQKKPKLTGLDALLGGML